MPPVRERRAAGMRLVVLLRAALALMLMLAAPPVCSKRAHRVRYPTILNRAFKQRCLHFHNKLRGKVEPPAAKMFYMTWDLALARTARAWAKKCIFEHNPHRNVQGASHPSSEFNPPGENIWIGNAFTQQYDPSHSIIEWHSELAYYTYQNNSCTKTCGQYTQIVWDTTYKLGCAVVFCKKLGPHRNIENFVCNYGPAGNKPRKPYETGEPCSACPKGDTCEDNLCRNPVRDQDNSRRYSRWYPPWEHRVICDESCMAVLILRPSLVLLAFVVAYCVQLNYPDLNCENDFYDIM